MKLMFLLFLVIYLKSLSIYRVYHLLPTQELRRRARAKDSKASAIYKAAVLGNSTDLVLWLFGSAGAIGMVLITAKANWWLASLTFLAISWLAIWAPRSRVDGWLWNICAFSAPYFSSVILFCQPVLRVLAKIIPAQSGSDHTKLFDKEDFLDLINKQNHQHDNRVPENELLMAFAALTFGAKKVSSIMTPKKKVIWVSGDEVVGPMLMDELHKTGATRFAVVKSTDKKAEPDVVGTLYLKNIIGYDGDAKVKDLMHSKAAFINEDHTLHQALDAFLKNHHHLLIVVNSFQEVSGVITLEDVLEQIVGHKVMDEFDNYEDLKAVAGHEAQPAKVKEPE